MSAHRALITGWDIGGAHLKAARCDQQGNIIDVVQVACPLWQGINRLEETIQRVQHLLNNHSDTAAITMTGELVDIFANRASGVGEILDCIARYVPDNKIVVYAGDSGWLSVRAAKKQWLVVASRNWQASASLAATKVESGLFIDIGSTTCDIIAIKQSRALPTAYTDHQRQISRELLYTGVVRTPLIALADSVLFDGVDIGLAAEVFATTGDCWCMLGYLSPDMIDDSSADGRSWQADNCINRIARLLGTDANQAPYSHWQQLALWFTRRQIQIISNAVSRVLSLHSGIFADAPIIGAGIGRFIAQECSERFSRPYQNFDTLVSSPPIPSAADHAPAVAVALLAQQRLS